MAASVITDTIHGVVRTDLMAGTDNRAYLRSAKFASEIDNGNVVLVGDLVAGEREVRQATAPAANSALASIGLVAAPEVLADERKHNLSDFYNVANKPFRVYLLKSGDIFSVTKEALDGLASPAVGNVVELKAGTKLNVAASATSSATQVGKIIAKEVGKRYTYYVIQVA